MRSKGTEVRLPPAGSTTLPLELPGRPLRPTCISCGGRLRQGRPRSPASLCRNCGRVVTSDGDVFRLPPRSAGWHLDSRDRVWRWARKNDAGRAGFVVEEGIGYFTGRGIW